MDTRALHKFTSGLYVVSTQAGETVSACLINTGYISVSVFATRVFYFTHFFNTYLFFRFIKLFHELFPFYYTIIIYHLYANYSPLDFFTIVK